MEKIFSLCILFAIAYSWDLNYFGIDENYYISSIAIYRARAFLALPRSCCHNNISNPTVVEVPWTGSFRQPASSHFRFNILEYQKRKECDKIQDAISLDMEPRKPKLWILDKGNEFCNPKILSYNVIFNTISEISELQNVPRENLNVITIDPQQSEFGSRIYIGNAGDSTLLVFSSNNLKWRKLTLRDMSNPAISINADYLAISKTDSFMYITGRKSLELFSINLHDVRSSEEPSSNESEKEINVSSTVNVTLIGQKLGMSTGLETDFKSGLSYYMVRDYVVVRWMIGLPMEAEYHTVLTQSYEELPYVSELFTDPYHYGLWALVNPLSSEDCQEANNTIAENIHKLKSRVVKVLKYNKLSGDVL
ncbi:uncharacterized protein LOC108908061 [Anoplophora glabripennis]|uniref:uncharacterized protein LOC108908061 n=1 Tax=Anoplophora glabripennis TaxID=217634 RepID=UPI00087407EC|nr:uncharacterized protein LOC108908061 [Anoplophora glabripennis]